MSATFTDRTKQSRSRSCSRGDFIALESIKCELHDSIVTDNRILISYDNVRWKRIKKQAYGCAVSIARADLHPMLELQRDMSLR